MPEEQQPKSRANKMKTVIESGGPQSILSNQVPSPAAATSQAEVPVLMRDDNLDDEAKLERDRVSFTRVANISRYVGIASGVGAIIAPLSFVSGDFSGFNAILPLVGLGLALMVVGIVFRTKAYSAKSRLSHIQQLRVQQVLARSKSGLADDAKSETAAAATRVVQDFQQQAKKLKSRGIMRIWIGGVLALVPFLGGVLLSPFLPYESTAVNWDIFSGLLSFGVSVFLQIVLSVLPLVGLGLVTAGIINLSRAKKMMALVQGPTSQSVEPKN